MKRQSLEKPPSRLKRRLLASTLAAAMVAVAAPAALTAWSRPLWESRLGTGAPPSLSSATSPSTTT